MFIANLNPFTSFQGRLFWALAFMVGVGSVVLSVTVGERAISQVETDRGQLLREVAAQMAHNMDKRMFERSREIQIVAATDMFRDPSVPLEHKRRFLEQLQSSYREYAWIGITDAKGNILTGTGGLLVGKNVAKRDWFIEGSKGPHAGDVHDAFLLAKLLPKPENDDLPLRLVDVSAPIRDHNGELVGVICGHLSWEWARKVRKALLQPIQGTSQLDVLVLNRFGHILMGTPELPDQSGTLMLPSVEAAQAGKVGAQVETWEGGRQYLTGYARGEGHNDYPGLGWITLVREATDEAFAPARTLRQDVVAITLSVAAMVLFTVWLVLGRIVRPMRAISLMAERIREGDRESQIPRFPGRTELTVLADSLHAMVDNLRQQEQDLRLSSTVFEHAAEGIIITDAEERIISVNHSFRNITGYADEDILGHTPRLLQSGRHDKTFYQRMHNTLTAFGVWSGEIENRRKDGDVYPEWLTISAVKDDRGRISNYIGVFTDISERRKTEEHIRFLAHHDSLTRLPNRNLLYQELERTMRQAQRDGTELAVLFVDLDAFKNVNDSVGHHIGDLMLQEVAARVRSATRGDEFVARFGGDEFVVVLPVGGDNDTPSQLAERITRSLAEPYRIQHYSFLITSSVGVAAYPQDGVDVYTLLKNADAAMYLAKHNGRNNYQFFTDALEARARHRLSIETALRGALANDEFSLAFQPQIDITDNSLAGVETLLRWHSPALGWVSPAEFIPVAEETGLISDIGLWVLRSACTQYQSWRQLGLAPVTLGINVSGMQLRSQQFAEQVLEVFDEVGVDPKSIELEITEGVMLEAADRHFSTLAALRTEGVKLALDDFGTGYSSLSYLRDYRVDRLKIDRSFVEPLLNDPTAGQVIDAITGLANALELEVVVEGVELAGQVEVLRAKGLTVIQGFYFARPMGAEQFATEYLQG